MPKRSTTPPPFIAVPPHYEPAPGDALLHASFGEGVVRSVEANRDGYRVAVAFKRVGFKLLQWSVAQAYTKVAREAAARRKRAPGQRHAVLNNLMLPELSDEP